jgi:hypothetical protein
LAIVIFCVSDAFANSASPWITSAGGPAGMSIILNQRIGSDLSRVVFFARPYMIEMLRLCRK